LDLIEFSILPDTAAFHFATGFISGMTGTIAVILLAVVFRDRW
jgi:hypothetical protein